MSSADLFEEIGEVGCGGGVGGGGGRGGVVMTGVYRQAYV